MTRKKDDASEAATSAGIAVGQTLAATGEIGTAALAGLVAFTPYVVGRVIPGFLQRKERETRQWWDRVVNDNGSDTGAAAEIASRSEDPATQEVILAAFKVILEEVSPAVISAVAMLTREYARQGKSRDAFFRGASEVLADVSAEEYADLRALTKWISGAGSGFLTVVHYGGVVSAGGEALPDSREHLALHPLREQGPQVTTPPGFPIVNVRRLFQLLKTSGLGTEASSGYWNTVSGPQVLACDAAVMRRLASLLI